ncbi:MULTISPECIES: hypothetical protein [Streptomyces]|uniref:hypothetical protein n=1 Tax=Streptomyces TaxID=1883 RepID=UPI00067CA584|nr:hypothetical protein I6J40_34160 [Streptomyces californicus]
MKSDEEIMEILEAYDLTGSYRKAAELGGCDHHTVRRYVQLRGQGVDPTERAVRSKLIDDFLPEVEELVERSRGRVGADAVHKKIAAMGLLAPTAPRAGPSPRRRSPTWLGTAGSSGPGYPNR